jgi:hypothetical protein
MKIALYKASTVTDLIFQESEYVEKSTDYIRTSEFVEVNFIPLPPEETTAKELAALDSLEQFSREQLQKQLDYIEQRRGELRALTHTP